MRFNDESILYAVDTVLVYVGTSLEMLTEHLNSQLREIFEWCYCSNLSFNSEKSNSMTVTNKILIDRPQLFIDIDSIEEIDSFKCFGLHIDTRLKFNVQSNHLKGKFSQLCGVE